MNSINLLPIFMVGLLGSVHCVGMCGGVVGAFTMASTPRRAFPVAVVTVYGRALEGDALRGVLHMLAYNTGRIGSYAIAGAFVGGLGASASKLSGVTTIQSGGYWLTSLMLVALGLYLMNIWHGLSKLEALGQGLWRRLQPLMKHLLPLDSPIKALALGGLWGWLPCGMVYSMLLTAMLSGSAVAGASVMLAFGLGTLPTLLALGAFSNHIRAWAQRRQLRLLGGLIILCFGVLGLIRAGHGMAPSWLDAICVTPAVTEKQ